MSEIRITKEKLESVQQKLTQYMLDSGYEGSLEDGTGIYDLAVKANSLISLYLQDQLDKAQGYLSLREAERFRDILGPDYDDAIDSILSNWFVSRKKGTEARCEVRFWFSRPLSSLKFSEGETIVTIDGHSYHPVRNENFIKSDFISELHPKKFLEEFYVTVEVESADEGSQDINTSSSVTAQFSNRYYLRSRVHEVITTGDPVEDSASFIERTKNVITTRELITYKALDIVLQEEFRDINKLYVAGYGDKEQHRDVVEFDTVTVHVGNKADIYVNGNYRLETTTYEADGEGKIYLDEITPYVFDVDSIDIDAGSEHYLNSEFATVVIDLGSEYANTEYDVKMLTTKLVKRVSEFVFNNTNKVICYSPVVKALFPIILEFEMKIEFKEGNLDDHREKIEQEIVNHINKLEHGSPYVESRLIDYIHGKVPEIKYIEIPIQGTYKFLKPESLEFIDGSFSNYLCISDIVSDQKQVSENTVEFYTHTDFITCKNINEE